MSGITIQLDRRFKNVAKGAFEKYNFDVGILHDRVHRQAQPKERGLKTLVGGPARKTSGRLSPKTMAEISKDVRVKTGVNFYTRPFKLKANRDILRFSKSFFELCTGRGQKKRCENLLQAIVRNPIARGDYGPNKARTKKIKGFSRLLIDTGQLFKAIKAVVRTKRVQTRP